MNLVDGPNGYRGLAYLWLVDLNLLQIPADLSLVIVKHQTIEAVSSLSFPQFFTGANNYTP